MNKTLTIKDYELISAFLDSACSPKEVALVEARIQSEPAFSQAIAEFKRAKYALSKIPHKRAPRNFTLSAAMVPQKSKRSFWAPTLNFVALGASLMLAVVFVGSKFFGFGVNSLAAKQAIPMMAAAPAESASADNMISPIITWQEARGMGGGGGDAGAYGIGGGPAADTFSAEAAPNTTSSLTTEATPEIPAVAPETSTMTADEASGLILGMAPQEEQGTVLAKSQPADTAPTASNTPWLLISEISLGAVALVSVIASLLLRRR